jgi:hypothetical protein
VPDLRQDPELLGLASGGIQAVGALDRDQAVDRAMDKHERPRRNSTDLAEWVNGVHRMPQPPGGRAAGEMRQQPDERLRVAHLAGALGHG